MFKNTKRIMDFFFVLRTVCIKDQVQKIITCLSQLHLRFSMRNFKMIQSFVGLSVLKMFSAIGK